MVFQLFQEGAFERDLKRITKRNNDLQKLQDIVSLLVNNKPIPPSKRNHKLKGNFDDCWECHIEPNWLLIYRKTTYAIILVRTGTHSDLF